MYLQNQENHNKKRRGSGGPSYFLPDSKHFSSSSSEVTASIFAPSF